MAYVFNLSTVISYIDGSEVKSSLALDDIKFEVNNQDMDAHNDSIPAFIALFADIGATITIPNLPGSGLEIRRIIPRMSCRYTEGEETYEFSAFRDDDGILIVNGNGSWEHFDSLYSSEITVFIDKIWPGAAFQGPGVTATVINLDSVANRQLITVSNSSATGFGIATSAFHLSEDSSVVGTLYGQGVSLETGVPKDLYLVGASTDGPGGPGLAHNGTVNGVHFQATYDGTNVNFVAIATIRHHPGPNDWATRTFDSLPNVSITLASEDYSLLFSSIT